MLAAERAEEGNGDALGLKMKVEGEVEGEGEGGGATVLVGVKFDGESKELLTWALVKVAQPGDQIIALHILNTATGMVFLFSLQYIPVPHFFLF